MHIALGHEQVVRVGREDLGDPVRVAEYGRARVEAGQVKRARGLGQDPTGDRREEADDGDDDHEEQDEEADDEAPDDAHEPPPRRGLCCRLDGAGPTPA